MIVEREGDPMSADGTYNGYRNFQTWNVCLWLSNDENLNRFASECEDYEQFVEALRDCYQDEAISFETPDEIPWKDSGIDLYEMQEFWEENFSKAVA